MHMTCCPCLLRKRKTPSINRSVEIDEEFSGIQNVKMYSYEELRAATGDFSLTNKIGEGGYGSVYKGKFKGGHVAAIKVLSPDSRQGVREFLTELNVISDIEHENLVKLDGCCVQGNQRILVYGYLENNSLAQTLLGKHSRNARHWEILGHDGNDNTVEFDWKIRTKICIGVARGLAYLHEEVHPHIVHRDIKASNILLDKDLTPKISDFGLAKLIPANKTHVSTRVAGTIGYLAPEYAIRGQLTRKADIYSFGVLLLEIISGRCNTNEQLAAPEDHYLLERTWQLYELGDLAHLIDPSLDRDDHVIEEACRFIRTGLLCTQEAPKLRPSMSSVVKMLEGEMKVDNETITKPGLISDFMDLKVRNPQRLEMKNTSSTASSGMSPPYNSSLSSEKTTTHPSVTFTPEN